MPLHAPRYRYRRARLARLLALGRRVPLVEVPWLTARVLLGLLAVGRSRGWTRQGRPPAER